MENKLQTRIKCRYRKTIFYMFICAASFSYSQVGVGNTDPQATLDITASNQTTPSNEDGILIPRVDAFPLTNPTAFQNGMLIYLTTTVGLNSKGFYYWNAEIPVVNSSWIRFSNIEKLNDLSDGKSDVDGSQDGSSIFIGINAGANDDSDNRKNVGVGFNTLNANTDGSNNAAFGHSALSSNTANNNSAFGFAALEGNITGVGNSAFGKRALEANTASNHNTAMGADALRNNNDVTGVAAISNTAIGNGSLFTNTFGSYNVAVGHLALRLNETGSGNTAVGTEALTNNDNTGLTGDGTSTANTAVGYHALHQNVEGLSNTGVGYEALNDNVSSDNNTAFGHGALKQNISGGNTAIGAFAGALIANDDDTSTANVLIGQFAGEELDGFQNVIIGQQAGRYNIGDQNVFLGRQAGRDNTGSSNVFIGNRAGFNGTWDDVSNTLLIQNENSDTPLVYGVFDNFDAVDGNGILRVNGVLQVAEPGVTNGYAFPPSDGTANQILVTDGAGQLTFEDQQIIPVVPDVSTFTVIRATYDQTPAPTFPAPQVLSDSGWQKLIFDAVEFDVTSAGEFKTVSSSFEPDNAGIYRINSSFQTTTSQTNTDYYGIAVFVNGDLYQEYSANHYYNLTNSSQVARQITCILNLTDTDVVEIYAHNTYTAIAPDVVAIDTTSTKTHFTIERIR